MGRASRTQQLVVLLLVMCGTVLAACGTIIGFPDRVLDESDSAVAEASTLPDVDAPDAANDTSTPVDAGPAHASLSTTALDFGLVTCGAAAPAPKVLTITNFGGEPLVWTAKLAPTPDFSLTSASAGTVAPGAFATLTIASIGVSALSGAGDTAQGILLLTTNDAMSPAVSVPIKRTAAGGTLTVVPLTASFGETPVGVPAQSIPIALKNTGNQAVTVGLGAITPAGGGFVLGWTNAPAAISIPAGGTLAGLVAGFNPTAIASFSGNAAINVTGALCGTNPASITFTGGGTSSPVSVQPGSLDFGLVDCGTDAIAKKVRIVNSGAQPVPTWNASLALGSAYTLSATMGGPIAPGSFAEVTVTPNTIPSTSAVSPNLYGDTLTITTTLPGDPDPHPIDLLMTARGAIVDASATALDFGSVLETVPATTTFTVSNSGNAPATVSYSTNPSVFTVAPQGQVVGAGATYTATARFAPVAQQSYTGKAIMTVSAGTVLCAPVRPPINLSGAGATGGQISPTTVDFGLVSCGATGTTQTVTLSNTSADEFAWTASLSTAYFTIDPASGTLAAGASADITVTPQAIPAVSTTAPDFYGDTLVVSVPSLGATFRSSLHMTAEGAILSFFPTPTLDFGLVKKLGSKTKPYAVVNSGNFAAPITLIRSGSQYSMNPSASTASAGSSATLNASFNPTSTGTITGSIAVNTPAKLCAPLPPALNLTGQGF